VRTRHHMRPLLRFFIEKVPFFHPAPHPGRRRTRSSPICNPASHRPLQARVMHNHAWAQTPV
jgi:hypothetical protein